MKCPHCDGSGEMPDDKVTIGEMILMHRKARDMTQADLAPLVGLSRPQVANIEGGRTDLPVSRLMLFAKALGVTMKELIP